MLKRVMECGGMIRIQFGNPLFQLLKKVEQKCVSFKKNVSTFKKSGAKMCQLLRKVEQKCVNF